MGKMKMDENIREELEYVVEDIRKHNGKPYDLEKIINVAVANVMCQTALGQRYEYTNAEFIDLQDRFEENVRAASITSPLHHFKVLQYLPIQTSTEKIIHTNYHHVGAFLKKVVEEHKRTFDGNEIRDFIDAYLAEIARTADKPDSTFTEAQLNWMIYDMFIAGSETTATSLRWGILYMMHFPDIQRKVQAEIDEVIGRERVPTGRDRTSLPYTDAVINEIFRHSSIVSMAIPHTNTERDVTFRGYTIPKNAFVFGNIYAAHRDPALFKRPNDFDPENFLDENGKLTNTQNMIAFCVGKRACLGEGLARMEMFLFFTRLLQLFNFENPKNEALPPLDRTHGMIAKPFYHYKVCATSR
ncbi:cytochrome P450 2J4-like [Tubulanus polymorphus]|uniref:cytochrome P450 2J4-like n=1 Tax=Tubulanus polymorphus TaxID=672921 RepID=UPI003DA5788F